MDNIINFKPKQVNLPIKERKGYCSHNSVEVDEEERDIRCQICNQRIDAFDLVWKWAIKERNTIIEIRQMERTLKLEQEKLTDLERQVSNLKAQKNRLLNLIK